MHNILVCPFGNVNLLVTLCERLRAASGGGYNPTYLCFTRYEREMYRAADLPHLYIAPGESGTWLPAERLADAVAFTAAQAKRHLGDEHRERMEGAANHYARRIACALEERSFDSMLFFNGRHNLFVAVLDHIAELTGCPKLVFEQGLFRPDYLTIDGQGVNWRNSLRSLAPLLSDEPLSYQRRPLYRDLTAVLPQAAQPHDYKRGVGLFALSKAYAAMKLEPRWRIFLRSAENRDLLESACFPASSLGARTNLLEELYGSEQYDYVILCPLQVETDTQIVLHSPNIPTMQSLIDHVSAAVQKFNARSPRKACVVFKTHPQEPRAVQVTQPDCFLINESTVSGILKRRCDLVITINSTAGIEGIEAGKPVITLGQAFYSFPGVVSSHCENLSQLDRDVEEALTSPAIDRELQRRFIEALRNKYQASLKPQREPYVTPPPVTMPGVLSASHAGV